MRGGHCTRGCVQVNRPSRYLKLWLVQYGPHSSCNWSLRRANTVPWLPTRHWRFEVPRVLQRRVRQQHVAAGGGRRHVTTVSILRSSSLTRAANPSRVGEEQYSGICMNQVGRLAVAGKWTEGGVGTTSAPSITSWCGAYGLLHGSIGREAVVVTNDCQYSQVVPGCLAVRNGEQSWNYWSFH